MSSIRGQGSPSPSKLSLSEKLARRLSFAQKPKSNEPAREPFRGSSTLRPTRNPSDTTVTRRSHAPKPQSPTATVQRSHTTTTMTTTETHPSNRVIPIEPPSDSPAAGSPGPRSGVSRRVRGGIGGVGGGAPANRGGMSRRGAPGVRGGRGGAARGLPTPQGAAGVDPKNAWVPFQAFATGPFSLPLHA